MDVSSDFAQSAGEAARTLNEPRSLDDIWQTIVEVATDSMPGFDHVGIATLEKTGDIETRAFTGNLVLPLDKVQYWLRQGPCSAALQGSDAISVSSLKHEQRWPGYVPVALEWGVRSQMAVRLYLGQETLGGVNLYSTTSDEVSDEAQATARQFATYAAIALGHAQEREELTSGMQSRKTIGEAIGILMARYEMNEDRAFAFLVRASSHENIKLRDVAQQLVDEANAG